jgi:hypothetical protein
MYPAAPGVIGLSLSSRAERGYVIAALSGELDIAAAPMLREKLLGLLGPGASRLIIDLSAVSYADARGPYRPGGHRPPRPAARRILAPGRAVA